MSDVFDTFPTHNSVDGKGGWRELATIALRNSIPASRRTIGMIVNVTNDPDPNNNGPKELKADGTWQALDISQASIEAARAAAIEAVSEEIDTLMPLTGGDFSGPVTVPIPNSDAEVARVLDIKDLVNAELTKLLSTNSNLGSSLVGYDPISGRYPQHTIGWASQNFITVDGIVYGLDATQAEANANRALIQSYIDKIYEWGGGKVYLTSGLFMMQPGIKLKKGVHIYGSGTDEFERIEYDQFSFELGTNIILKGDPFETFQVDGISDRAPYGGVVPNPDSRWANDFYSLTDFTNKDAVGTTPATLKNLSYGFLMDKAHSSGVHGLRVAPEFRGIAGYSDHTTTEMGNAVDFGIVNLNSKFVYCSDFQCFGEWRKAALGVLLSNMIPDINNAITFGLYERAQLAGFRCIMVRGTDMMRVTAKTANTVEIPWSSSNRISVDVGGYLTPSAGTPRTFTGATQVGDKLTLTGVNITTNFTVGGTCYPASNFGSSWNEFRDIYCLGWSHPSNMPASLLEMPYNSCGIEIDGHNLRTTIFNNVKVHDRDVFIHAHQADDTHFIGSNAEAPQTGSSPGFTDLPRAARCIVAPGTNGQWFGAYGAGGASLTFDPTSTVSGLIDMVPAFNKTATTTAKYPNTTVAAGNGLCRPATLYGYGIQGQTLLGRFDGARNYAWGNRTYTAGGANRWGIYDQTDARLLAEAYPALENTFFISDGITSGSVVVADDAVGEITTRISGGIILLFVENAVALPRPTLCGMFSFGLATTGVGTSGINKWFGENIDAGLGAVTGTTGVDGHTTIGFVVGVAGSGKLQFENRTGLQVRYRYTFIR